MLGVPPPSFALIVGSLDATAGITQAVPPCPNELRCKYVLRSTWNV